MLRNAKIEKNMYDFKEFYENYKIIFLAKKLV